MKFEFSRQIFKQYPNIKFHENPSSGSRVSGCCQTVRRTDRQTDRQTYVNHVFDTWPCKKPTNQITLEIIDRVKLAAFMVFSFIISLHFLLVLFLSLCVWLCFVCFCLILCVMYFYCYVYVFLLLCMFCSVYSVFIVPTGTLRPPWLRVFCAFSSLVRQMRGYNSQFEARPALFPIS